MTAARHDQPKEGRPPLASRIREARRAAGLSQSQVARLLGLQRPSVTEMESGNRRVSSEELARLADVFEVSPGWLLGSGSQQTDEHSTRAELAARELAKLKPADLDRLLQLLSTMRRADEGP